MVILFDKCRKREPYPPYSSVRHGGKGDSDTAKAKAFSSRPVSRRQRRPAAIRANSGLSVIETEHRPGRRGQILPGGVPLPVLPPYKAGGKNRNAAGPRPAGPIRSRPSPPRRRTRGGCRAPGGGYTGHTPSRHRGEEPAHMGGAVGVGIALIRPIAEIGGLFQPGVQKSRIPNRGRKGAASSTLTRVSKLRLPSGPTLHRTSIRIMGASI